MRLLEDQTAYDSLTGRNGWDGVFLDAQDVMFVSRQVNPYSLLRKHKVDHEVTCPLSKQGAARRDCPSQSK